MVLLNELANHLALDDPEERRVLSQVSWAQYEVLLADLGETPYRVHFVDTAGYEPLQYSEVLPNLDIALLARCLQNPNPLAAAKTFRQGLRSL